jgi:prepilin-type N-terminal cleavage/methylation domain-containing protein
MMSRQRAFSLVEILVAMSILLLITFIGTYGHRTYSRYWQNELGDYQATFEKSIGATIFFQVVKGIKPYIVKDDGKGFFYFEGGNQDLRSVTSKSLQFPEYPAVFEIVTEQTQNGKLALVYREFSMINGPVIEEPNDNAYVFERVLLTGIDHIAFEYYGWSNYIEKASFESKSAANTQRWYGLYSGKDTSITPSLIRITLLIDGETSLIEVSIDDFMQRYIAPYLETGE